MKLFLLKVKYNINLYKWYYEEIREEYYTRWKHTMISTETTFRIVR